MLCLKPAHFILQLPPLLLLLEMRRPRWRTILKKYKTKELISFLCKEKELKLSEKVFEILENEDNGCDFFKITKEELERHGMKLGPATRLVDFAKDIRSNSIMSIPQFTPDPHPIDESFKEFKLCIDDILRRIKNKGPVINSNEAMRCEYISTILHTARRIGNLASDECIWKLGKGVAQNLMQCRSSCEVDELRYAQEKA
ncbi:hypothetical protein GLOIN_2v1672048 [Rhizophagus clarus]|uniref:SAM domain-containing protein n=1 Tax=Rhizophagus clarus TaxID=94130 RepID=A0A8H3MEH1_9GLOM|nr:hypothetical protein GLOIN_2v1672048 [Rhizophagus clarus]